MKPRTQTRSFIAKILQRDSQRVNDITKRVMDLSIAAVGLLISAPIWFLVPLAIWLEDGGSAFIRQKRVGRDGRLFTSWKFRSMRIDDGVPHQLVDLANDPRITRVGRSLRSTALDELPQLWNILRGDMSFVGPRALPLEIQDVERTRYRSLRDVPGFGERITVRPGLTGIAQLYAPRDIGRREKFRYDLVYVRKCSLCLDIRLVLLSIWVSLRGKWEARGQKL